MEKLPPITAEENPPPTVEDRAVGSGTDGQGRTVLPAIGARLPQFGEAASSRPSPLRTMRRALEQRERASSDSITRVFDRLVTPHHGACSAPLAAKSRPHSKSAGTVRNALPKLTDSIHPGTSLDGKRPLPNIQRKVKPPQARRGVQRRVVEDNPERGKAKEAERSEEASKNSAERIARPPTMRGPRVQFSKERALIAEFMIRAEARGRRDVTMVNLMDRSGEFLGAEIRVVHAKEKRELIEVNGDFIERVTPKDEFHTHFFLTSLFRGDESTLASIFLNFLVTYEHDEAENVSIYKLKKGD